MQCFYLRDVHLTNVIDCILILEATAFYHIPAGPIKMLWFVNEFYGKDIFRSVSTFVDKSRPIYPNWSVASPSFLANCKPH
jgi:hypothetical protein